MPLTRIVLLLTVCTGFSFADLLVSRGTLGVDRYSNSGTFLGNLIAPGSGGLVDAQGVAVGPNGDLFVGDFSTSRILRFSSDGTFLNVFSSDAAIDTPFDVVFGPGGDLYVASAGPTSNIARLDGTTGALVTANFTSGNPQPIGGPQYLEFGPNNVLYITDIAGRLFRFNSLTGMWISTSFYDNPEGVAYGPDDFVYLVQRISDNVLRIPPLGGPSNIVIPNGAFTGTPQDIEFGPNGLIYLSADRIYRFDTSGTLVDSFGTGGEFITFFEPIPEPSTYGLMLAALAAGVVVRRTR